MSEEDQLRPAEPFTEKEFLEFAELYYQTEKTGMSYKASLKPEGDYCRLFATAALTFKKTGGKNGEIKG